MAKPIREVMTDTATNVLKYVGEIAETIAPSKMAHESVMSKKREDRIWKAMTESPEHLAKPLVDYLAKSAGHSETETSKCGLCQLIDKKRNS